MAETIKIDKLLEVYPIKVPTCLKHHLEQLSDAEKSIMLSEVRLVMARHVHNSAAKFDPSLYLCTETSNITE
jgi:hypothetical protein